MEIPPVENSQRKVQELCELGQDQLSAMRYLDAEKTLAIAERMTWGAQDWDSMSRLYLPLQEARRQRRQRCAEGRIKLDYFASGSQAVPDGEKIAAEIGHGQTLIAGWGSIQPAVRARKASLDRYVDVFLAAVFPMGAGRIVAIVPGEHVTLPAIRDMSVDSLIRELPAHSIVISEEDLRAAKSYAATMALWERLHGPFLAAADATVDPIRRIEEYRQTIAVDYACELAHQNISIIARKLAAGERA